MKTKLIIAALALSATTAFSQPHGYRPMHGGGNFIVPMIVGGAIAYAITEANRQPPVIVQQVPAPYPYPPASELFYPKQVQPPQPVYGEVMEYDPQCRCYWRVTRQIGWK